MKKIVCIAFVALMAVWAMPAKAQLKFGIKGGVNVSSVHFSNFSKNFGSENVTGFHIGPMLEAVMPVFGVGVDAAILYSQKGVGVGSEEIKTDYIDVPVNLKWKFGLPILKGYLSAGPYVGFRVGGDKFWEIPGAIGEQWKTETFSAGLNFGVGIELISHLQVGFNYGLGLTDNYKLETRNDSYKDGKNRGWAITAALLF